MPYKLTRNALGFSHTVELTRDEYVEVVASKRKLLTLLDIEEKRRP